MKRTKEIFTFRDAQKQTGPVAFMTMLKPAEPAGLRDRKSVV